ncbi:hypothetical protein COY62_01375 [bacterium (Candidatus Howlettbacteria) CG_4_10_14_0_8_um_filter_40_9]|nr:MAG: hypothetical protein COY62_01375 [bacterium (Candidatus Howlettbacteria) CG_4_10_14_0_8_um_filter_40_9]
MSIHMENDKNLMPIGKAAQFLGVSIMTLRRWDATGKLPAIKSPSGYRYYERKVLERFREDIFSIAKAWAKSQMAPDISEDCYCGTQDRFRARLERMATLLNREQTTFDLAPLLTAIAGEIGNNSFDHNLGNWPDVPGVFFSYNTNKRIIVLADRGVGIKATLKRVCPELKDDISALRVALTERISGRAPEQRGNGLKFVVDVAKENPVEISLQSGIAVSAIGRNGAQVSLADENIRGTLTKIGY